MASFNPQGAKSPNKFDEFDLPTGGGVYFIDGDESSGDESESAGDKNSQSPPGGLCPYGIPRPSPVREDSMTNLVSRMARTSVHCLAPYRGDTRVVPTRKVISFAEICTTKGCLSSGALCGQIHVCHFDGTAAGCRNGPACKWLHPCKCSSKDCEAEHLKH